jgi:FAD:protein FMN transferase
MMGPYRRFGFVAGIGFGVVLAITLLRILTAPQPSVEVDLVGEERTLMGTQWSVQVAVSEPHRRRAARDALDGVFAELSRIDALMSEWRPESPLSGLNRSAGGPAVELPGELADIIRRGIEYGDLSRGAFDITWRGLGSLWRLDESFTPPDEHRIAEARGRVDYRRIKVEGNRVALPEGFALGLGGIAKGYAIDRAGAVLRAAGFPDFLVNGGGDVLTGGSRGGRAWIVGILDPRGGREDLAARVAVHDGAVVTSGDYERYVVVDGVRYHHIIDPRTGRPADRSRSVTVVAPQAELADVLATAVFVLGPAEGLQLVSGIEGVEAFVIDSSGRHWMSGGFRRLKVEG